MARNFENESIEEYVEKDEKGYKDLQAAKPLLPIFERLGLPSPDKMKDLVLEYSPQIRQQMALSVIKEVFNIIDDNVNLLTVLVRNLKKEISFSIEAPHITWLEGNEAVLKQFQDLKKELETLLLNNEDNDLVDEVYMVVITKLHKFLSFVYNTRSKNQFNQLREAVQLDCDLIPNLEKMEKKLRPYLSEEYQKFEKYLLKHTKLGPLFYDPLTMVKADGSLENAYEKEYSHIMAIATTEKSLMQQLSDILKPDDYQAQVTRLPEEQLLLNEIHNTCGQIAQMNSELTLNQSMMKRPIFFLKCFTDIEQLKEYGQAYEKTYVVRLQKILATASLPVQPSMMLPQTTVSAGADQEHSAPEISTDETKRKQEDVQLKSTDVALIQVKDDSGKTISQPKKESVQSQSSSSEAKPKNEDLGLQSRVDMALELSRDKQDERRAISQYKEGVRAKRLQKEQMQQEQKELKKALQVEMQQRRSPDASVKEISETECLQLNLLRDVCKKSWNVVEKLFAKREKHVNCDVSYTEFENFLKRFNSYVVCSASHISFQLPNTYEDWDLREKDATFNVNTVSYVKGFTWYVHGKNKSDDTMIDEVREDCRAALIRAGITPARLSLALSMTAAVNEKRTAKP